MYEVLRGGMGGGGELSSLHNCPPSLGRQVDPMDEVLRGGMGGGGVTQPAQLPTITGKASGSRSCGKQAFAQCWDVLAEILCNLGLANGGLNQCVTCRCQERPICTM
jgi:hypothetical protein